MTKQTAVKRLREIYDRVDETSPWASDSVYGPRGLVNQIHGMKRDMKDLITILLNHHEVMQQIIEVAEKTGGRRIILDD